MPSPSPPPLKDAATIILAREQDEQLQIYLLRRSSASGFMGGLYVFPGGGVDPSDRDIDFWLDHMDLNREDIGARLCGPGFKTDAAVSFGVCAIRETLEEAGVLIAGGKDKTQRDIDAMAQQRLEKRLPSDWFKNSVAAHDWNLYFSSLGRWSHWITPEKMKKRFDTRFFIVLMPDKQTCVPDNLETKQGEWLTPDTALEKNLTGEVPLSPPTIVTLTQLKGIPDIDELKIQMAARPWGDPIAPEMIPTDAGPVIIEPWDDQFRQKVNLNSDTLPGKVLPAGSQFSRIWCDNGHWKPVGGN